MTEMGKATKIRIYLLSVLLVSAVYVVKYIFVPAGGAETVMGISHDLACPCECPMVLEDCHMSCALSWKDSIGEKLKAGLGREEINAYSYKRYGDEALLNPVQRMSGKWYQFTRAGPLGLCGLFIKPFTLKCRKQSIYFMVYFGGGGFANIPGIRGPPPQVAPESCKPGCARR